MAFEEDMDDFFADGDDATYTPQGEIGIPTQVIEQRDVEVFAEGAAYIHNRAYLLRTDHIANPKHSDIVTVSGTDYTVDATLKEDGQTILVAVR
jgi:hypothetical protein